MIAPPKYTRTAEEGSFNQHHNDNNFIDDESGEIDAPPPAYSRQSNWATSRPDVQSASEEGSISSDRPIVRLPPISSHLRQAYPPASHRAASRRGNPFVEDVRAWNAFQVVNLNDNNLVEINPANAGVVGVKAIDPLVEDAMGNNAALFGVTATVDKKGDLLVFFTDDNTNTLNALSAAPL